MLGKLLGWSHCRASTRAAGWALLLGSLLWTAPAFAQTGTAAANVTITSVRTAGTGCSQRSVSVVMVGNQASILFSDYNVTNATTNTVGMRNCTVMLQLSVPDGTTLSVAEVDWFGSVVLEEGARGGFNRGFIFGGVPQINVMRPFTGPTDTAFQLRDRLQSQSARFSGCTGRQVLMLANTVLSVTGIGSVSVDTVDLSGGPAMRIAFQTGTCQRMPTTPQQPMNPQPPPPPMNPSPRPRPMLPTFPTFPPLPRGPGMQPDPTANPTTPGPVPIPRFPRRTAEPSGGTEPEPGPAASPRG